MPDEAAPLDADALNVSVKSQIATDFVATLTEVSLVFYYLHKAMEDACFSRCFRKPGVRMDKTEEVCASLMS